MASDRQGEEGRKLLSFRVPSINVVGEAVAPRRKVPSGEPLIGETEAYEPDPNTREWSYKATVPDQYLNPNYVAHVREGPETTAVFDLGDPKQLTSYNEHKAWTEPKGSPSLVILDQARDWCPQSRSYHALLVFRRIEYERLIKKTQGSTAAEDAALEEIEEAKSKSTTNEENSMAA